MEATLSQLRLELNMDSPFLTRPYAMRPKCSNPNCGRSVVGHSYSHTVYGVRCHYCEYGKKPPRVEAGPPTVLLATSVKRQRWSNYVRPTHQCVCGREIVDARSPRCRKCAAKARENAKHKTD